MNENIELTILIPALNEEETIKIVVKKAKKWLKKNNVCGEVLVVNNGSEDNTKNIALYNGAKVIDEYKKGYGNALITGINNSKGKYIIMGDADDSYNFLEINEFYEGLKNGNDIIIGNRFANMEKNSMKWTHKYIGTPLLSWLVRKIYGIKLKDINCGLRGMNKEKIQTIKLKSTGMEFASEMIIKAKLNNLKIKEIPINFYKDKRKHKSNLKTIRDGFRHLKLILQMQ